MIAGGRDDPAILDIRLSVCHEMLYQRQLAIRWLHTRCGGFGWFKPVSMSVVSWRRADVVSVLVGKIR